MERAEKCLAGKSTPKGGRRVERKKRGERPKKEEEGRRKVEKADFKTK